MWKSIKAIQFKLGEHIYWVSVQNWFAFGPRWPHFGPLVAKIYVKMVVSYHYLKQYRCNAIQLADYTYYVRVKNFFTFGPRWPNFGPEVATKWLVIFGFRQFYGKSIDAVQFKLVEYIYCWMFRIDSLLGQKVLKMVVSGNYVKMINSIEFKLGMYTSGLSAQNWFVLGYIIQLLAL